MNVQATRFLVDFCKENNKKLLYISTDYVFDGSKDFYTEEDVPNPLSWYGITKYEGEKQVRLMDDDSLIVRIANPYRVNQIGKTDFVHKIINYLSKKQTLLAPVDQIITPTYVDDVADGIRELVRKNAHGIYHVVGGDSMSAYEASKTIQDVYNLHSASIEKTTHNLFFAQRAPRPCCAVLKHDKISKYGIKPLTFRSGLELIKSIEGEVL